MYLALQKFPEDRVNHAVTRDRGAVAESLGDDADSEVAGSPGRPRVTGVQVTLVLYGELQGMELVDEALAQALLAGGAIHGGAASDRVGLAFTLPFSQMTWGIMKISIAAVMPKTLNLTHTPSG